ncbi:Protein of unknown function [Actinopolyspora saharensis]|uniref:DUF3558 domain-containing protein n=1 Tax=Actinopolyspora saharensis TaxID=995062 RepID=A0A1H1FS44_9ACTN|nr:Protein of unknown function [Actinopolyspora saharensis]
MDIANPKDAAATDVCSLLSARAATELGLSPEGERKSSLIDESDPDSCYWQDPGDRATKSRFRVFEGRSIQSYYENPGEFQDFKKLTISGYPAARANKGDPVSAGSCNVYLATQQNQLVATSAHVSVEDTGKVDPCAKAKKALKLSVSSWPAAE